MGGVGSQFHRLRVGVAVSPPDHGGEASNQGSPLHRSLREVIPVLRVDVGGDVDVLGNPPGVSSLCGDSKVISVKNPKKLSEREVG